MALPKIFIPKEYVDEARDFADKTIDKALKGLFGVIENVIEYRRKTKAARLHRRALFHQRMAQLLRGTTIRIVNKRGKIDRHQRLELWWGARAYAYDKSPDGIPGLAPACGLCQTSS